MGWLAGEYSYQMDPKGRLRLPSSIVKLLSDPDALMIGIGSGEYLNVFTKEYMEQLFTKYSNVDITDYESINLIRELFSQMRPFSRDNQGRYQIPVELRNELQLSSDLVIVGIVDRMEIWDAEKFKDRNKYRDTRRKVAQ